MVAVAGGCTSQDEPSDSEPSPSELDVVGAPAEIEDAIRHYYELPYRYFPGGGELYPRIEVSLLGECADPAVADAVSALDEPPARYLFLEDWKSFVPRDDKDWGSVAVTMGERCDAGALIYKVTYGYAFTDDEQRSGVGLVAHTPANDVVDVYDPLLRHMLPPRTEAVRKAAANARDAANPVKDKEYKDTCVDEDYSNESASIYCSSGFYDVQENQYLINGDELNWVKWEAEGTVSATTSCSARALDTQCHECISDSALDTTDADNPDVTEWIATNGGTWESTTEGRDYVCHTTWDDWAVQYGGPSIAQAGIAGDALKHTCGMGWHEVGQHLGWAAQAGYCFYDNAPADDYFSGVCEASVYHSDCGTGNQEFKASLEDGVPKLEVATAIILSAVIASATAIGIEVVSYCLDSSHENGPDGAIEKQQGTAFCGARFLDYQDSTTCNCPLPVSSSWELDCETGCSETCNPSGTAYATEQQCDDAYEQMCRGT